MKFKIKTPLAISCYQDKKGNLCAVAQLLKWVNPETEFIGDVKKDWSLVRQAFRNLGTGGSGYSMMDLLSEIEGANNHQNLEITQRKCDLMIERYKLVEGTV